MRSLPRTPTRAAAGPADIGTAHIRPADLSTADLSTADISTAPRSSDPPAGHLLVRPLLPGVRPCRRADGAIQLGAHPIHGVVLTGMSRRESVQVTRMLERLAVATGPIEATVLSRVSGLALSRVAEVAGLITDAGLVVSSVSVAAHADEALWTLSRRRLGEERIMVSGTLSPLGARRAGARVVVDGHGRLVSELTRLLRAAGVRRLRSGWYAAVGDDLTEPGPDATLVIAVSSRLPRTQAVDWHRRGVAHLPVVARPGSADIGPLVIPGAGPCVECVALLHDGPPPDSADDGGAGRRRRMAAQDIEPTLAAIVAGTTAMLALGHLDAYPAPPGVRWHTALPLPSLATSTCRVHPRCENPAHRPGVGARHAARALQARTSTPRQDGTLNG
jgi:hypothetical protein